MQKKKLVIIGGVSGSGKSTALRAFEDLGYFCIENLPASLLDDFVEYLFSLPEVDEKQSADSLTLPVAMFDSFALLVNCRGSECFCRIGEALEKLRAEGWETSTLFLDCKESVVVRRFQETRRPHPLLLQSPPLHTIADALNRERELLADMRAQADGIIDTSSYTPHELRSAVERLVGSKAVLEITFTSFGFKYGAPKDADLVIDVRFLPNPHFVPGLRELTGEEPKVRDYVFAGGEAEEFLKRYLGLLEYVVPRYADEGKRYLNIAVGCTGGRHRSVAICEELASRFKPENTHNQVLHRDLDKKG